MKTYYSLTLNKNKELEIRKFFLCMIDEFNIKKDIDDDIKNVFKKDKVLVSKFNNIRLKNNNSKVSFTNNIYNGDIIIYDECMFVKNDWLSSCFATKELIDKMMSDNLITVKSICPEYNDLPNKEKILFGISDFSKGSTRDAFKYSYVVNAIISKALSTIIQKTLNKLIGKTDRSACYNDAREDILEEFAKRGYTKECDLRGSFSLDVKFDYSSSPAKVCSAKYTYYNCREFDTKKFFTILRDDINLDEIKDKPMISWDKFHLYSSEGFGLVIDDKTAEDIFESISYDGDSDHNKMIFDMIINCDIKSSGLNLLYIALKTMSVCCPLREFVLESKKTTVGKTFFSIIESKVDLEYYSPTEAFSIFCEENKISCNKLTNFIRQDLVNNEMLCIKERIKDHISDCPNIIRSTMRKKFKRFLK